MNKLSEKEIILFDKELGRACHLSMNSVDVTFFIYYLFMPGISERWNNAPQYLKRKMNQSI